MSIWKTPRKPCLRVLAGLILVAGYSARTAAAPQDLHFDAVLPERIKTLLADHYAIDKPLAAARIDLNEDGTEEIIVADPAYTCPPGTKGFCAFEILADRDNSLLSLGKIRGKRVQAGNAYNAGVRNILTFGLNASDFQPTVYVWEPLSSRYNVKN